MDLTRPTAGTGRLAPPILQPESAVRTEVRTDLRNAVRSDAAATQRSTGYGLPCSNCRLYYSANLDTCPACNSSERISATVAPIIAPVQATADLITESVEQEKVEQEREEFLKQFKSQLFAEGAEAGNSASACSLGGNHAQPGETASVCKPCYDRMQERVDVFEAALHIDLKEAAQIIYDAVWADPSDPSKTYTNAASALISELRRRSGVSSTFGPFQSLGN